MNVAFDNPAGFWALLGVPTVLAIHFLQRESRRVLTSTLFLLDALQPVSAQGRRWERLRGSLPLYLQLAAVLLLTALLVGPRFVRRDSAQRVTVVLNSSVSLLAFREDLNRALTARLRALNQIAGKTEWRLIETDTARATLYAGSRLPDLLTALAAWTPHLGTHDFRPALNAARSLTRSAGVALFATDRPAEVPEGVEILAVGHPLENCGWLGVTVEGSTWRALVQNHGTTPQTRAWHVQSGDAAGLAASLTLAPGQSRTLSGEFPPGKDRCELVLSGDGFALDDRLPIVRPEPKRLAVAVQPDTPLDLFLRRLAGSVPRADVTIGPADVNLALFSATPPTGHTVLFATGDETRDYLTGDVLAENHPLTTGLGWNGLLCKAVSPVPPREGDEVLLWQGERPLVFLRGGSVGRSLVVNFDVRQSNADRLPAFVVLLNRFLESVRAEKVGFERLNVELNQRLEVAAAPHLPAPQGPGGEVPLRAPAAPGFFEVTQDKRPLLTGAAYFSDVRMADFHDAATLDTLADKKSKLIERNSQQDILWPVGALLLGAVCLTNWAATGGRASRPATGEEVPA